MGGKGLAKFAAKRARTAAKKTTRNSVDDVANDYLKELAKKGNRGRRKGRDQYQPDRQRTGEANPILSIAYRLSATDRVGRGSDVIQLFSGIPLSPISGRLRFPTRGGLVESARWKWLGEMGGRV